MAHGNYEFYNMYTLGVTHLPCLVYNPDKMMKRPVGLLAVLHHLENYSAPRCCQMCNCGFHLKDFRISATQKCSGNDSVQHLH